METAIEIQVNKKTLYRPFKRSFKNPTNTVTKWINNIINEAQFNKVPKTKASNSRGGSKRVRFSSIKGFCKLQPNGQLY